jgi:hypothetical protein
VVALCQPTVGKEAAELKGTKSFKAQRSCCRMCSWIKYQGDRGDSSLLLKDPSPRSSRRAHPYVPIGSLIRHDAFPTSFSPEDIVRTVVEPFIESGTLMLASALAAQYRKSELAAEPDTESEVNP